MFQRDALSERIAQLHRDATNHKSERDMEAAIKCLTEAQTLMPDTETTYPISTWLKLPLYLQQAGHFKDAMAEFRRLAKDVRPRLKRDYAHRPAAVRAYLAHAELSTLYDKMRLACKREKRPKDMERYAAKAEHHGDEHQRLMDAWDEKQAAKRERDAESRALRKLQTEIRRTRRLFGGH